MSIERARITTVLAITMLLVACAAEEPACWSTGDCEGGAGCRDVADCRSRVCSEGVCEAYCETSRACPAGAACIAEYRFEGTTQTCRSECGEGGVVDAPEVSTMVCEGGALKTCDELADPSVVCDVCGCPTGEVCEGFELGRCDDVGSGCRCIPE